MFKQQWQQIYRGCSKRGKISRAERRDLIELGLSFCNFLKKHHDYEEKHVYPPLAKRMPQFKKHDHLKDQHEEIDSAIASIKDYLMECRHDDDMFEAGELNRMMDGIQDTLLAHLDDEVDSMRAEAMCKHWTVDGFRI